MPHAVSFSPDAENWLREVGLAPPDGEHPDWGFKISFSTVPVPDWTIRRSRIGAQELWLGVSLSRVTGWIVTLFPRDDSFRVTWRPGTEIDVMAQSIVHRHKTPWPLLPSLTTLPQAIPSLELLLGRKFLRSCTFFGPSLKTTDFATLSDWLGPVCDSIDFTLGNVHGPLPTHAEVEDHRKQKRGLSLRLALVPRHSPSGG